MRTKTYLNQKYTLYTQHFTHSQYKLYTQHKKSITKSRVKSFIDNNREAQLKQIFSNKIAKKTTSTRWYQRYEKQNAVRAHAISEPIRTELLCTHVIRWSCHVRRVFFLTRSTTFRFMYLFHLLLQSLRHAYVNAN